MTDEEVLRFDDVSKSLARRPVLCHLTFALPAGRITALLGPNGAGKTTAVSLAVGLRRPSAGSVHVLGRSVLDPAGRAHVSLVPQEIGFPDSVTVARCLHFVAQHRRWIGLGVPTSELVDRLGVGPLLQRRIGGLSGGERRKLALTLGLVHAPPLVVLDEATTNLDEQSRATTWSLVQRYADSGGTVLVTSHILGDIETHADRVVVLDGGRVIFDDDLQGIQRHLGGTVVQLGLPSTARTVARDRVRRLGLGAEHPCPEGVIAWHTAEPTTLLRALLDLTDRTTTLTVRPVPLGEVLASRTADSDAREPAPRGAG